MGNCKDCGKTGVTGFASHISFEGELSDCSPLKNDNCISVEEVLEDHDAKLCDLISSTSIDLNCDDIDVETQDGKAEIKDVVKFLADDFCARKSDDTVGLSEKEVLSRLDFKCLQQLDDCDNPIPIDTYVKFFQALIDKVCE